MNAIDLGMPSTACVHTSDTAPTAHDVPGARVVHIHDVTGTVLHAIAHALAFPAHFGDNWDALVDCLRDIDDRALVLVVHHATLWFTQHPRAVGKLVETWVALADEHVQQSRARHLVFVW